MIVESRVSNYSVKSMMKDVKLEDVEYATVGSVIGKYDYDTETLTFYLHVTVLGEVPKKKGESDEE